MKVYSVLIASVTLFVFYNLAVFQENICENKNSISEDLSTCLSQKDLARVNQDSNSIHVSIEKISDKAYQEAHHVGQDDFALQVSGKDHQYLNTGVSFIVIDEIDQRCDTTSVEPLVSIDNFINAASQSFFAQTEEYLLSGFYELTGEQEVDEFIGIETRKWSGINSEKRLESFSNQDKISYLEITSLYKPE